MFVIRIDYENTKKSYKQIFNYLRKNKIWVNLHYLPIYNHPFYKKLVLKKKEFKNMEDYYKSAISIPIYPGLSFSDQIYVKNKLKKIL